MEVEDAAHHHVTDIDAVEVLVGRPHKKAR